MDLPINDADLSTIVKALALGGDARLYHLLKEVKKLGMQIPMVLTRKFYVKKGGWLFNVF